VTDDSLSQRFLRRESVHASNTIDTGAS